jgi:hypothetical protein
MSTFFKWIKESLFEILKKKTQNANVEKSPQQNRERPAMIVNGNIYGPIIFVESIHIEHSELSLNSGTYVQNGLPPTSHSV